MNLTWHLEKRRIARYRLYEVIAKDHNQANSADAEYRAADLHRSRARSARRTCLGGDESGPIKPDRYNENGAPIMSKTRKGGPNVNIQSTAFVLSRELR